MRFSTVALTPKVRLAARRQHIADIETDRQPGILEFADIEFERRLVATEHQCEVACAPARILGNEIERGDGPRAEFAGSIEPFVPQITILTAQGSGRSVIGSSDVGVGVHGLSSDLARWRLCPRLERGI